MFLNIIIYHIIRASKATPKKAADDVTFGMVTVDEILTKVAVASVKLFAEV